MQEWWFAGFDSGTNLIIDVETEFASYILCEPNEDYLNLFTKFTKNMILTKLIIESLLKNPDSSYEALVLSIEENQYNEESIILFSQFIVEQIKSFDAAAEEGELLLSKTPAFRTLVLLSGVSSNSKDLIELKSRQHVRPIARIDCRKAANSDTLTCSTGLVTQFFDSVFKDVIECESNSSQNTNRFESTSNDKTSRMVSIKSNKKINWIGTTVYEDTFARTAYYSAVKISQLTVNIIQMFLPFN